MEHGELIRTRFPDLAAASITAVGDGWTCDTYDVDGVWIVQIARSAYAADRLRAQAALLPELAREVSAPIPLPEHVSLEDGSAMIAYRRIIGAPCTDAPDGIWPERLGRFLYDLHSVPPEYVGLRAVNAATIRERERAACAELSADVLPLLDDDERAWAEAMLTAFLDDDERWVFAPCLTHRDLGPEHVLVDERGDLAGVIDWEEADLGDPAGDFAWWLHDLPAPAERALAAYGGAPDRRFRERTRFLHALMPWHEVRYGVETGQEAFVRSGLHGVRERMLRAW